MEWWWEIMVRAKINEKLTVFRIFDSYHPFPRQPTQIEAQERNSVLQLAGRKLTLGEAVKRYRRYSSGPKVNLSPRHAKTRSFVPQSLFQLAPTTIPRHHDTNGQKCRKTGKVAKMTTFSLIFPFSIVSQPLVAPDKLSAGKEKRLSGGREKVSVGLSKLSASFHSLQPDLNFFSAP